MKRAFLVLPFLFFSAFAVMAEPNCPEGHCAKISEKMNKYCIKIGLAGQPFLVMKDGVECFCPCSCVTPETELDLNGYSTTFGAVSEEDQILMPMANDPAGDFSKKLSSNVTNATLYHLTFESGTKISASENHVFVDEEERTVTASELHKGDQVLDANLQAVSVTEVTKSHDYTGALVNLIMNAKSENAEDHVISIGGILSGDWLLQTKNDSIATGMAIRTGRVSTYDLEK